MAPPPSTRSQPSSSSSATSAAPSPTLAALKGLGQVQLKLGVYSSLSSFEKVFEVYLENCASLKIVGHIYVKLDQNEKALEIFRTAARIDPKDAQSAG